MENNKLFLLDPNGKYIVGITHVDFTYKTIEGSDRKIPLTIFYPAQSNENKEPELFLFKEAFDFSQTVFGNYLNDNLLDYKTNCYPDVTVLKSEENYPVVIYNHGFSGFPMQNATLCSDLASNGYIVVSVGHPGTSAALKYTNGDIASFVYDTSIQRDPDAPKKYAELVANLMVEEDINTLLDLAEKRYSFDSQYEKLVDLWVEDTISSINHLEVINNLESSILFNKMRLDKIAITGHSLGGTTAAQAARDDKRIVCGINIDGSAFGNYRTHGIDKPFFTISIDFVWRTNRGFYLANKAETKNIVIDGITHVGFMDFIFTCPELPKEFFGTINPEKQKEMLIQYHLAYFGNYLLNQENDLNDIKFDGVKLYERK